MGELIPVPTCTEGAGSRIPCPRDCPHFPFAEQNYSEVGDVVARAKELLAERFGRTADLRELCESAQHGQPGMGENERYLRLLLQERNEHGRTFFEEWEREGWLGVRNDRRLVLRSLAAVRIRVLQVEAVRDDTVLFVRDLLADPAAPLVEMRDRTLCRSVPLYCVILAPIGPLAHYHMGWLFARPVPHLPTTDARTTVLRLARHLGYSGPEDDLTSWLLDHHLAQFDRALSELQNLLLRRPADSGSADSSSATDESDESSSLVPVELAAEAKRFAELGWEGLEGATDGGAIDPMAWLDEANPWFGRTPREAAADPASAASVRQLLVALFNAADDRRLARRPFVDWTPAAAALGWPELRHTLPAGWTPPRAAERRGDDQMRKMWPEKLQRSSESAPAPMPLTKEELDSRAQAQERQPQPSPEALSDTYADVIAVFLVETDEWEGDRTAVSVVLKTLLEACLWGWGLETPRFGVIPGRARERREALENRLAELAGDPAEEGSVWRALVDEARQPLLVDLLIARLLQPNPDAVEEFVATPTDVVALIPLAIALLDEVDLCVRAWAVDRLASSN